MILTGTSKKIPKLPENSLSFISARMTPIDFTGKLVNKLPLNSK